MNINAILSKLLGGNKSTRDRKLIQPIVEQVLAAYPEINKLTNDELRAKTKELQQKVQTSADDLKEKITALKAKVEETPIEDRVVIFNQIDKLENEVLDRFEKALDEILPVAFAIVKDTARRFSENETIEVTATDFDRELAATHDFVHIEGDKAIWQNHWVAGGNEMTWNMVHYDVQLFGGTVLHQGKISEMATGEGKTLVATLPVYLNALTGNGVHVVTVNDYLAKRDSEWMGPLYMFHGLSVDCIDKHQPNSEARRRAYRADITFGTNNEFGFDYLRDNMAMNPAELVQRKHNYAIVDEVDSVLIDDARTPLIISGPVPKGDDQLFVLPDITTELSALEADKSLSDEERLNRKDALLSDYAIKSERVHTILQLLKAYTMFQINEEYVVLDGQVKIVDEQTGRIMEGRRWSDGLHQAVEAKEHVKVEAATQTFATITLQNYFRMYHKLAGMTGTAITEAGEFWNIYKLDVVEIPTNRPVLRKDMNDRVYKTKREKYAAVIAEVEKMRLAGRPCLVGTTSVDVSELLSRMLDMRHIPHQVLNAKLHQREADIVARAGESTLGKVTITLPDGSTKEEERMLGAVTIATNMAGRGTDIKLTDAVKQAGGLAIIGTERHESRRVDRQLRGRAGRQGDPGSSVFFVSLEDNLMRLFASERIARIMDRLGFKDGDMIEAKMINNSIERAQKKVEENNFGIRKRLLEYDDVMNKQRTVIYEKRRHALMGERIGMDISNMIWDRVVNIVSGDSYKDVRDRFLEILAIECPFTEQQFSGLKHDELEEMAFQAAMDAFRRKTDRLAEVATPVIRQVYENQGQMYDKILVPITDGRLVYNIRTNLREAYETDSKVVVRDFEKAILLHNIDDAWKENLRELDELKKSVQNASYEQKDPLLIFKLESAELFSKMVDQINNCTVSTLMRGHIPVQEPEEIKEAAPEPMPQKPKYQESHEGSEVKEDDNSRKARTNDTRENVQRPIVKDKMPQRNDPCPCGSGKKFKNCHGRGIV